VARVPTLETEHLVRGAGLASGCFAFVQKLEQVLTVDELRAAVVDQRQT
jgi:hypothetical protein